MPRDQFFILYLPIFCLTLAGTVPGVKSQDTTSNCASTPGVVIATTDNQMSIQISRSVSQITLMRPNGQTVVSPSRITSNTVSAGGFSSSNTCSTSPGSSGTLVTEIILNFGTAPDSIITNIPKIHFPNNFPFPGLFNSNEFLRSPEPDAGTFSSVSSDGTSIACAGSACAQSTTGSG